VPNYEYRCPWCEGESVYYHTFEDYDHPEYCPHDGVLLDKVLGAYFKTPMQGGYSPSTGSYVSSERDLADQLKVASEAASNRTGISHNFVPIDMRDRAQTGQTDDGLDATIRREVAEGKREVKQWL